LKELVRHERPTASNVQHVEKLLGDGIVGGVWKADLGIGECRPERVERDLTRTKKSFAKVFLSFGCAQKLLEVREQISAVANGPLLRHSVANKLKSGGTIVTKS